MTPPAGKAAEHVSAEELKAAVKATPSLAVLLRMFNGLGKTLSRLADFSREMNMKNIERSERLDATEKRLVEVEKRLASIETRQAVTELRSARP